jgi:hypothetical protein
MVTGSCSISKWDYKNNIILAPDVMGEYEY